MSQKLNTLIESASQTAGPYVHIGLMPTYAGNAGYYDEEIGTTPFLDEGNAKGEIVEIVGSVFDGTGWAMRDALIESWQCDASGLFAGAEGSDPAFTGHCRFAADADSGEFTLRTVAVLNSRRISRFGLWRGGLTSACKPASISKMRTIPTIHF